MNLTFISHKNASAFTKTTNAILGTRGRLSNGIAKINAKLAKGSKSFSITDFDQLFESVGLSWSNNSERYCHFFVFSVLDYYSKITDIYKDESTINSLTNKLIIELSRHFNEYELLLGEIYRSIDIGLTKNLDESVSIEISRNGDNTHKKVFIKNFLNIKNAPLKILSIFKNGMIDDKFYYNSSNIVKSNQSIPAVGTKENTESLKSNDEKYLESISENRIVTANVGASLQSIPNSDKENVHEDSSHIRHQTNENLSSYRSNVGEKDTESLKIVTENVGASGKTESKNCDEYYKSSLQLQSMPNFDTENLYEDTSDIPYQTNKNLSPYHSNVGEKDTESLKIVTENVGASGKTESNCDEYHKSSLPLQSIPNSDKENVHEDTSDIPYQTNKNLSPYHSNVGAIENDPTDTMTVAGSGDEQLNINDTEYDFFACEDGENTSNQSPLSEVASDDDYQDLIAPDEEEADSSKEENIIYSARYNAVDLSSMTQGVDKKSAEELLHFDTTDRFSALPVTRFFTSRLPVNSPDNIQSTLDSLVNKKTKGEFSIHDNEKTVPANVKDIIKVYMRLANKDCYLTKKDPDRIYYSRAKIKIPKKSSQFLRIYPANPKYITTLLEKHPKANNQEKKVIAKHAILVNNIKSQGMAFKKLGKIFGISNIDKKISKDQLKEYRTSIVNYANTAISDLKQLSNNIIANAHKKIIEDLGGNYQQELNKFTDKKKKIDSTYQESIEEYSFAKPNNNNATMKNFFLFEKFRDTSNYKRLTDIEQSYGDTITIACNLISQLTTMIGDDFPTDKDRFNDNNLNVIAQHTFKISRDQQEEYINALYKKLNEKIINKKTEESVYKLEYFTLSADEPGTKAKPTKKYITNETHDQIKTALDHSIWLFRLFADNTSSQYGNGRFYVKCIAPLQSDVYANIQTLYLLLFKKMAPILDNFSSGNANKEYTVELISKILENYLVYVSKAFESHMGENRAFFDFYAAANLIVNKYESEKEIQDYVKEELSQSWSLDETNTAIFHNNNNYVELCERLAFQPVIGKRVSFFVEKNPVIFESTRL